MADQESDPNNDFPAPMIRKRQDQSGSLNLDEVDMSKEGVHGDVAVTKGRSSTSVTKLPEDGSGEK